ncbi:MAG TPA: DMT family transporter [Ktedonobacterales bacterium]|nr:DMT family transporter [Ktedonobacterales bacterium]
MARSITLAEARTDAVPATRLSVYLMLALGIVCISLSAIFTKQAGVPGTVSAFYRIAIAEVALTLPFARAMARGRVVRDRRVWLLALGAGVFFALDLGLWNTSLLLTSAANATLLGNDAPIVVGLGALILFRERLVGLYWVGLAVALAGMGIIVGKDLLVHSQLGGGDLLAMSAGIAYAGYLLATQKIRAKMDTLSSLFIPSMAGMIILLGFNLAQHRSLWGFSAHTYLVLLALGLISQLVGWLAINFALGHLKASTVSATLLSQPVLTALFAVPMLGEQVTGNQILGGAVALAGIFLVNRSAARG